MIGRHLFDTTNGWDGKPAAGDQLVVVTHRKLPDEWLLAHPDAPFHTADSVGSGIALASHAGTVLLDDPDQVVKGDRVLHLHYTVKR